MFGCILCERNNEWVYSGYLCEECIKVQKVIEILSKVLIVEKFVDKPVLEPIEAAITRSKK